MNKLSSILLLSLASGPIAAMGDRGQEIAAPAYPFYPRQQAAQHYSMAAAQPAFAAPQVAPAGMQLTGFHIATLYNNNEQLLNALGAQNSPLFQICLNNKQILLALSANSSAAMAAQPSDQLFQANHNLWRAQQALARGEQEDAPKRIDLVLQNAEHKLKEKLVTTKQSGHDMIGYVTVSLEEKELQDAIEQYVAHMSTVESSLMTIIQDQYISQPQSDTALKLLMQARHQAEEAKNAGLKKPLSWADLNARWPNQ